MFITPAYAQSALGPEGGFLIQMVPFVLIFIILYFLIIRPQQRRTKEHAEMIGAVRRGDTVTMSGGLMGKVAKVVDDAVISIEIAPDVKVKVSRSAIADVRSKGEPVKDNSGDKSSDAKAKPTVEKASKGKKT